MVEIATFRKNVKKMTRTTATVTITAMIGTRALTASSTTAPVTPLEAITAVIAAVTTGILATGEVMICSQTVTAAALLL